MGRDLHKEIMISQGWGVLRFGRCMAYHSFSSILPVVRVVYIWNKQSEFKNMIIPILVSLPHENIWLKFYILEKHIWFNLNTNKIYAILDSYW